MGERNYVQMIQVTWPRWPPCPYMVKTFKIFFSGTERPMTLKLGLQHWVLPSSFKWWPLPILWQGKIWSPMLLCGKKLKQWIFQKLILVYDIKVCRCSQLYEYMKLYEYQGHLLTFFHITIHVIRSDIVGTHRYWAPKYESRPTDRNSRYIWIPIFRFCQKLKLVFRSPQTLALSKFTTGSGNQTLLVFHNR